MLSSVFGFVADHYGLLADHYTPVPVPACRLDAFSTVVPPACAGAGAAESGGPRTKRGGRAERRGRARIRELTGGVIAVSGGGGGGDGLLWWVASTAGGGRRRAGVSLGALMARRGSGLGSAVLRALGGLRAGRRVSERGDPESTGSVVGRGNRARRVRRLRGHLL